MKKSLLLVLGSIVMIMIFTFTSCPDDDEMYIRLQNKSQRDVVAYIGGEELGEPTFPDTLLPSKNLTRSVARTSAVQYFFKKNLKKSKVCVFFLDQDTITKYGWDKVRDDYMILERCDVNEAYLRQKEINWVIAYDDSKEEE